MPQERPRFNLKAVVQQTGLKPHLLWGAVGLAMRPGLPLLFGSRACKTRRLLEGAAA